MKKRSVLWKFILTTLFVMMICLPVQATSQEQEQAKSLKDESVNICQVYLVKGNTENTESTMPIPKAKIFDGIQLLEKDIDYTMTLEVNDDDGWITYVLTITGKGDYQNEEVSIDYEFTEDEIGEELVFDDWTALKTSYEDEEGDVYEECYLLSYNGDATEISVPDCLGKDEEYEVMDIYPGLFYNKPDLVSVDLTEWFALKSSLFIDCPKLTYVMSAYDTDGGEYVETTPGPLVVGELEKELTISAASDYAWLIYNVDSETEEILTIQDYCATYGYMLENADKSLLDGDWTYQISADDTATVVSYSGTATSVIVPEVAGEEEYSVYNIETNAFSGLETLEEIDLRDVPLISSLCKNCPNLKKIICRETEIELEGPIVEGNAPAENELTIWAYPGIEWTIYNEETDEEIICTLEEYCAQYGYKYKELQGEYVTFDVVTDDDSYTVIGGELKSLHVYAETESDGGDLEEIFPDASIKDWKVIGEAAEYVTINNAGELTVSTLLNEPVEIIVECTVVYNTVNDAGETVLKEATALSEFELYPRLTGEPLVFVLQGGSKLLSCKQNVYSEDGEIVEDSLPEDVTASYTVENEKVAMVKDGVVTVATDATVDATTTITATYMIDEKSYPFTYEIKVVEQVKAPEVGTETIYIYGWNSCGFDKELSVFKDLYPELANQIEYINLEVDLDEGNPWESYASEVQNAMETDKAPDIVMWPAEGVAAYATTEPFVSLDQIGFDGSIYASAFSYTKENGMVNDKLYAITMNVNPGCFVYNKAIAKEVFGTDDAVKIQEKVKDWATFVETVKELRTKNYYMLSNLDLAYPVFGSKQIPWVEDNALNVNYTALTYLSLMRQLYMTGAVEENMDNWDFYGDISYKEDCFGFFADADYITQSTQFKAHNSEYGICAGPVYYSNDCAPYMTATNTGHNNDLVKFLLETMVSNGNVMKSSMSHGLGIANHEGHVANSAETENAYSVFLDVAKNVSDTERTAWDSGIEWCLAVDYYISYWVDEYTKEKVEQVGLDDLLSDIKASLEELYPSMTIEVPQEASWIEFVKKESDDEGNTPGTGEGDGDNTTNPEPSTPPNPGPGTTPDPEISTPSNPEPNTPLNPDSGTTNPDTGIKDDTTNTSPTEPTNPEFGNNSIFTKGNNRYKVLSVKGKKGTVVWLGLKSNKGKTIKIPNTVKKNGIKFTVTKIADKACKNNKQIKKITIPKNVTSIGKQAFSGCKNLKTIKINSKKITYVGKKAFKGIHKKAVIDVPSKKVKSYKKLFKKKGQAKTVVIK